MSATPPGWPFFAPSPGDRVEAALDLAELAAGEHLVDLGCGDGQVLAAAARRGARATGVECDPDLAATAAPLGDVVVADLFAPDLLTRFPPPDVVFCYLSPATLQRLTPRLRDLPSETRLVTVDYPVPDLVPDAAAGGAFLYRCPVRRRRPRPSRTGWPTEGTLCVMPPSVASLTVLGAIHAGGRVELELTGGLARCAAAATGTDDAARGGAIAVDLCWQPCAPGTSAHGYLMIPGLEPHLVVVLYADDDQGQWDLTAAGCTALLSRLRTRSLPPPTRVEDLLGALT